MVRTCIACGKKAEKSDLIRIVRTPKGSIGFDATGNAAGRGAYVCSIGCFEEAKEHNRFSRALRTRVDESKLGEIAMMMEGRTGAPR